MAVETKIDRRNKMKSKKLKYIITSLRAVKNGTIIMEVLSSKRFNSVKRAQSSASLRLEDKLNERGFTPGDIGCMEFRCDIRIIGMNGEHIEQRLCDTLL
jgi:hypothetical protein